MQRKELNEIYKELDHTANEIVRGLVKLHGGHKCSLGWFNGHCFKDDEGNYQKDGLHINIHKTDAKGRFEF